MRSSSPSRYYSSRISDDGHRMDPLMGLGNDEDSFLRLDEEPSFNLRLIDEVKKNRCLYDTNERNYRNSDVKLRIWTRLVQHLNFDGDSRGLYNRWKQLRDKYGKEKKKIKYGGEHTTWQYFKHLTFLDPHMSDRNNAKYSPRSKDGKLYLHQENPATTDPLFSQNLIAEVQQQHCLYDIRDPKYRHSEYRNQAWATIIQNLKYPGDINSIYKQWKKLRDRYVREKKRIRQNPTEESPWELYGQMQWIDSYLEDRANAFNTRHPKRKRDLMDLSDEEYLDDLQRSDSSLGYVLLDKHTSRQASHDVMLDGDSAFGASVVSDIRTLPEHTKQVVKMQIEQLLECGVNGLRPSIISD